MDNILDLSTGVNSVCCCCWSGFAANDGQLKTSHKLLNCLRRKKCYQWPVWFCMYVLTCASLLGPLVACRVID